MDSLHDIPEDEFEVIDDYDQEIVTRSLGKLGKSTTLLLFSTIISMLFIFITRIVIARYYSMEQYGLFSLFYIILTIAASISTLGLGDGLSRYIAYYKGKGKNNDVRSLIRWGFIFSIISSIIISAFLYLTADFITPYLVDDTRFSFYLKIVALTTPFFVIARILITIYRGIERAKEKIIFTSILKPTLILVFVSVVGIMTLPFDYVIIAISISYISASLAFFLYFITTKKRFFGSKTKEKLTPDLGKKLLLFSLPLLLVSIMTNVMHFTDTVMLAFFKTEIDVGIYNAAKPLSHLVSTGLLISLFIYQPIASRLFAINRKKEIDVIYTSLTKWVCFFSFPIAMCFIIFPTTVITIYGSDYVLAASTLQVLASVYLIQSFFGPNHTTLIAYGRSKFVMYANIIAAATNVLMNLILIPIYGPIGAATATGISVMGMVSVKSIMVYRISGIHVFKSQLLKPLLSTTVIVLLIGYFVHQFMYVDMIVLVVFFALFYILFFAMMILTKSISKEDMDLFVLVERKTGLDMKRTKKIIKRFL